MNMKKVISSIMAVALVGTSMATLPANAEVQDTYTATLYATVGTAQFWDDVAPTKAITGDGQYSIELTFSEPTQATDGSGVIFIDTDINPYDFLPEGYSSDDNDQIAKDTGILLSVDSVTIDGTQVEYTGPSVGAYKNEANNLRLNLYNVWGNDVKDINFDFTVESSIKIDFSVTGLDEAIANAKEIGEVTTTNAPETPNVEVTTTTDGKVVVGDSGKVVIGDSGKEVTTTTTTKTTTKASSPATSDKGVASILVALGLATISAAALRKKED